MTTNTTGAIVQSAYEDAGLCSVGQVINAAQLARGIARLNDVVALENTQGLKLWFQFDIPVPLVAGVATYSVGPGMTVNTFRPLQVVQGYWLPVAGSQQPLTLISQEEYYRLIQISSDGAINSFWPQRRSSYHNVTFWPTPDAQAASGMAHVIIRAASTDVTQTADPIFYPAEWASFLRWALADELATGQPKEVQDRCAQRAITYREALDNFDVEDAPTFMQADGRAYGGGKGFR